MRTGFLRINYIKAQKANFWAFKKAHHWQGSYYWMYTCNSFLAIQKSLQSICWIHRMVSVDHPWVWSPVLSRETSMIEIPTVVSIVLNRHWNIQTWHFSPENGKISGKPLSIGKLSSSWRKYKFSKILIFTRKLKFCHWQQILRYPWSGKTSWLWFILRFWVPRIKPKAWPCQANVLSPPSTSQP